MRKNRKDKSQPSNKYNSKKKKLILIPQIILCFGCGKQEHIKAECPNVVSKDKVLDMKYEKKGKSKREYIAWQDNDDSSSNSTSRNNEEVSMSLMAKEDSDTSSASSNSSANFENYSQLLDTFKETHEEANMLAFIHNRLKVLSNWLENKVKPLEEELNNSKNYFHL